MRRFAIILLAALAVNFSAQGATTREQLALAEEAGDTYARIELIRRILEKDPDDALSEELVNLWLSVSDYDMAEAALKDWKNAPGGFQARVQAEVLYSRDEKRDDAIALLERYHGRDASDLEVARQLARYYADLREQGKIVQLLSGLPDISGDAPLLLARASAKRSLSDFDGALADFAQAEKADAAAANNVRASYDRIKNALPFIKASSDALVKNPDDFSARVNRAYWHLAADADRDLVREDAEAAHKLAPQSVAAILLYTRAACASKPALDEFSVDLGKPDLSPESLGKLLKLDQLIEKTPGDSAALTARAFLLNDSPAQYRLALKDAETALASEPTNSAARLEKIFAQLQLGQPSAAAAEVLVMEKTSAPPARLAKAYGYLADADLKAYRLESALDYATKALKASPSAQSYQTRAAILQRLGRVSEAQADLEGAKKLGKKP